MSNRDEGEVTSKDEMSAGQNLTLEHFGSNGFPDDTKTQGDDKEHEEGQRISSGSHNCHCEKSATPSASRRSGSYRQTRIQSRQCFYRGHLGSDSRLANFSSPDQDQTNLKRTQVGDHFDNQETHKPREIVLGD